MLMIMIAGHVTLDRIRTDQQERRTWVPGGPAVHASLAAASLGIKPHIVSKIGRDFGRERIEWLRQMGVDTRFLKVTAAPTTKFEIRYRRGRRSMRLLSECEKLRLSDLRRDLRIQSLHIGPVTGEIPEVVAKSFADQSMLTSLDPQGYLRRIGRDKRVLRRPWLDRSLLRKIDVLKVSTDELRTMTGIANSRHALRKLRRIGPSICIHTKGGRGSDLSTHEGVFRIPAYKPKRVVDPTGAGDAFMGVFLCDYPRSRDAVWSASLGAAVASLKVEKPGPDLVRDLSKLGERANAVFSQVRRLE